MKKLKIFLLLSILLCFGFALSYEVHAQNTGPKAFEEGDVLPAGNIKISWDFPFEDDDHGNIWISIYVNNESFRICRASLSPTGFIQVNGEKVYSDSSWVSPYTSSNGNHNYMIIDTSSWSEIERTVGTVSISYSGYTGNGPFYWEVVPSGYSITFEENGGTSVTDLTEQTALPNPLPTTTKSGYTFGGWYYDSAFTQIANPGDIIESDVTLYAKWQLNTYTITYNSNGGSSISQTSDATQLPNPLPIPTKENYIFHGWYYDSDFTNRAYPGDPLTSDVILYAKWGLGDSPKIFEVGDVLPVEIIKLHVFLYNYGDFYEPQTTIYFNDTNWIAFSGAEDDGYDVTPYVDINTNLSANYIIIDDSNTYYEGSRDEYMDAEIIIDFSNCSLAERTVTSINVSSIHGGINPTWEVVSSEDPIEDPSIIYDDLYNLYNGEALDIELGYTLPAAKIAINLVYNNTGGQKDGMIVYTFGTYGRIALTAFEDMSPYVSETQATINVIVLDDNWNMNILHDSLAEQTFGSTRGILSAGMIIDLTDASEEERTITGISISNISDTRIEMDCIFSRILSIDESIYQDGYSEGYSEAKEIYGYYDDDTDQWLSVDEYIELYGEKMSSSNFYTNFDKYFIPAMIIVFGGAIVLTILKVFKGRE